MSTVVNERAFKDERIHNIALEREEEKARTNDAIVSSMINILQKNTPALAIPTAITKIASRQLSESTAAAKAGTGTKQLALGENQEQITKYLGEIAGVLGVVTQIAGSKNKAKEQDQHQDNLTKAIYHMQNGTKFGDIAPALGVGTARSMMGAAGTISAGSWLHDMATTGQLSGLTTGSLTMSNPGMMAAGLAGGIPGLGHAVGGGLSGLTSMAGGIIGTDKLNGVSGSLASLDPTTAAILGTISMIGTGIGAKKLMDSIMKNSPLAQKEKKNKWNLSHAMLRASDNPAALQSYTTSNNILKQMQNQNGITSAETLIASKLNEIAFNTSPIADLYEALANTKTHNRNSSTRALNTIDKETGDGLSGKGLDNLFKNGKLSGSAISFLKHNEGLKYLADVFNVGTYFKSLKGEDTAPGQFKLRDALNQGDPESAKKQFAMKHGLTMHGVELLHANIAQKIANADVTYEGRMLASGIYSNLFLQMIAAKLSGGSNTNLVGELARLIDEQERSFQAKQTMFVDGMIKPFMRELSKIPVLSATVPLIQASTYLTKTAAKGISGLSRAIANPVQSFRGAISGAKKIATDIRGRVVDSMATENVKNEQTLRTQLNAKIQTTEQIAARYVAYTLHEDLTDIKKLLGYTGRGKVVDRYSGERVDEDTLRQRNFQKRKALREALKETNKEESYIDEATNWMKRKVFNIKKNDIKKSTRQNYSHIGDLIDEFSDNTKSINDPDANFRLGETNTKINKSKKFKQKIYNIFGTNHTSTESGSTQNNPSYNNSSPSLVGRPLTNTQELINNRSIEERSQKFFDIYFENMPYLKRLYQGFFGKKEIKSGILSSSGQLTNPFTGLLGGNPDVDIDLDREERRKRRTKAQTKKRRMDRLKRPTKVIGRAISGAWNATKQVGSKVLNSGVGRALMRPLAAVAAGISAGAMVKGAGIAAMAAAIGIGIDQLFNDGKATKYIWDSLKDSSFGKYTLELFDSAKNYYLNFQNYITDAFKSAWSGVTGFGNAIGQTVTNGINYITGGGGANSGPIQKSYLSVDQVNNLISSKTEPAERLKILQSKKADIQPNDFQQIQASILESVSKQRTEKYGWSMSASDVSNHMKEFETMDRDKRLEYYRDFKLHQNEKRTSGTLTKPEEEEYQKLNAIITRKFADLQQDKRSDEEKQNEINQREQSLKTIKETSISSMNGIQSLVKQSEDTQKGLVKNFNDQINFMAQQQANITNMLTITAKTLQKPSIYELDKTVISLIPDLKG